MQFNEKTSEWIDALTSGEYIQGKSCLKLDNAYCCLGVAAEIAGELKGASVFTDGDGKGEDSTAFLFQRQRDIFGLSEADADNLAGLNDNFSFTFDDIADLLAETRTNPDAITERYALALKVFPNRR